MFCVHGPEDAEWVSLQASKVEPTTWLRSKERDGCELRRRGMFGGRCRRHMSSSEYISAHMMMMIMVTVL